MTPFPFTDVTGAWRLRSRFRRIMIGAGGIYAETWVMAGLTLFWAQTQTGLLQTVILQVAIVAGALTLLFNLNPAVKLDGYFMLTDYLRRPNLAGRASLAARQVFARTLGATTRPPNRADLAYWALSYFYRWTIFAGIFWIAYQFDPRIAPVVLGVVVMLLLVRPLIASVRFAMQMGARPLRAALTSTLAIALLGLCFVPLPFWQSVEGQLIRYDTQFVTPTEAARLERGTEGEIRFETPTLDQQILDISLRTQMLENLRRARFASSEEQARLGTEIVALGDRQSALETRRAALSPVTPEGAVWTELASRHLQGAWVAPGQDVQLASLAHPVPARIRLRLDQATLDSAIPLEPGTAVVVRPGHEPTCTFSANLSSARTALVAVGGIVLMQAHPDDLSASCAATLAHGAAVRARLDGPDRSLAQRAQLAVARMLQNRLPIDIDG